MVNKYYQKHKERLQKEARERYENLSEEEKDKKLKNAQEGKKKKVVSIIRKVRRSYLTITKIII